MDRTRDILESLGFKFQKWDGGSAFVREADNRCTMVYQDGLDYQEAPTSLDDRVVVGFYKDGFSEDFECTVKSTLREVIAEGTLGTTVTLKVSENEFHTMLAALRFWQTQPDREITGLVEEIATNSFTIDRLDYDEIDELCERINTRG